MCVWGGVYVCEGETEIAADPDRKSSRIMVLAAAANQASALGCSGSWDQEVESKLPELWLPGCDTFQVPTSIISRLLQTSAG